MGGVASTTGTCPSGQAPQASPLVGPPTGAPALLPRARSDAAAGGATERLVLGTVEPLNLDTWCGRGLALEPERQVVLWEALRPREAAVVRGDTLHTVGGAGMGRRRDRQQVDGSGGSSTPPPERLARPAAARLAQVLGGGDGSTSLTTLHEVVEPCFPLVLSTNAYLEAAHRRVL